MNIQLLVLRETKSYCFPSKNFNFKTALVFFYCIILSLVFSNSSYSQLASYDLSNYARPDLERRTLALRGGAQLINSSNESFGGTFEQNAFSLNAFLSGARFKNSLQNQKTSNFYFRNFFDWSSETTNQNTKELRLNSDMAYLFNNRKFYQERRFFDLGRRVNVDYTYLRKRSEGLELVNEGQVRASVAVPILHGHGRTEIINDAWRAVTMLEMLEREGFLSKQLSHEEITAFADTLSVSRTKRYTDPRHETIYELETLSDYLVTQGFVSKEDFRFFAHMHDIYTFENFILRQSGKTFSYGLEPNLGIVEVNRTGGDIYLTETGLFLLASYENFRPVSRDWQFDHGIHVGIGQSYSNPSDNRFDGTDRFSAFIAGELRSVYYPSQRTNFTLTARARYEYARNEIDFVQQYLNTQGFNAYVEPRIQYYVSPQLIWSLSGRFSYNQFGYENQDDLTQYASLINFTTDYFFY